MKRTILNEIETIKKSHIKWHAYAEAIILGIKTESNIIPKAYTDCEFGKWYYGNGQHLSFIYKFKELEEIHIKLHKVYLNIYKQKLHPKKKYFFNLKKNNNEIELKQSVLKLKRLSKILIEKFDEIKSYILKMDEDLFTTKYHSTI